MRLHMPTGWAISFQWTSRRRLMSAPGIISQQPRTKPSIPAPSAARIIRSSFGPDEHSAALSLSLTSCARATRRHHSACVPTKTTLTIPSSSPAQVSHCTGQRALWHSRRAACRSCGEARRYHQLSFVPHPKGAKGYRPCVPSCTARRSPMASIIVPEKKANPSLFKMRPCHCVLNQYTVLRFSPVSPSLLHPAPSTLNPRP